LQLPPRIALNAAVDEDASQLLDDLVRQAGR
jgi:hypothetical protein